MNEPQERDNDNSSKGALYAEWDRLQRSLEEKITGRVAGTRSPSAEIPENVWRRWEEARKHFVEEELRRREQYAIFTTRTRMLGEFRKLLRDLRALDRVNGARNARGVHTSWPAFWHLFSFVLPKDVHEEVFQQAFLHLLRQYAEGPCYSGRIARWWINFAFAFQTLVLGVDCVRSMLAHRVASCVKELFFRKP